MRWLSLVLSTLFLSSSAFADTISYVGEVANAGASASLYGTDGYVLYTTSPVGTSQGYGGTGSYPTVLMETPSYLTSVSPAAGNSSAGGFAYSTIDNPAGGTVKSGFTYATPSAAVESDVLTFTVGSGSPSAFYVGYITNIDPSAFDYVDALRLRQTGGAGAGNSGLINTTVTPNGGIDVYLFEVSGAAVGDSLTFSGIQTQPNGNIFPVTAAGLVFSQSDAAATPLPSSASAGLGLLGGFGLFRLLKLRHRATIA